MSKSRNDKGKNRGPSQRQLRAGELLRHALADMLQKVEINDPELEGVVVTVSEVRATPDLKQATAYVTPLGGKEAEKIVTALNRHKKFVRGELGHMIEQKYTPEIKFEQDRTYDEYDHITQLLRSPRVAQDLD